ncbi:hypothetical protein TIFTF001_037406 [Ficus carica]|uniref:Uncharacterized protein n=1 Tax=Ficus carica TaxID=3494 RepID=A0AA88E8P2_FICCA|nr:hypothetical protein TIFTF001_037406 [Ficus carica]
MAPSKAKKIKETLEGDSHDTNASMSKHNTETNNNDELTFPDLVKAIHMLVHTQNDIVQEMNELKGSFSQQGASMTSKDKGDQQGAFAIEGHKTQAPEEGKGNFLTQIDVLSLLEKHLYNTPFTTTIYGFHDG